LTKAVDYKKDFKHLYVPPAEPVVVEVPQLPFIMLGGSGDPNGEAFVKQTEALYSISYAVKMSYRSGDAPAGYYAYKVFPLEGIWDLVDYTRPSTDKSNFKYTLMIRQPDFLTEDGFRRFLEQTKRKKSNPYLDHVRFERMEEGLCCQMLHIGQYDDEPASFARMEAYCAEQGYVRASKTHREIYLSDPRKTEPAKLKTVLRFQVHKR